jgi:tetrahydromethanopterin S-methyltransferase subunit B
MEPERDIVDRLIALAMPGAQWTPETLAMVQAANEIDRLREKVENLEMAVQAYKLTLSPSHRDTEETK